MFIVLYKRLGFSNLRVLSPITIRRVCTYPSGPVCVILWEMDLGEQMQIF